MKDLRSKNLNILFKGKTVFSSNNDEERVKDILNFMGVNGNKELIQTACGYLSINNMEVNINNVETFLKEKNIVNTADLRKKAYSVINVNSYLSDVNGFINNMKKLGYENMTDSLLTKIFNSEDKQIEINIKVNSNEKNVETITGYSDSKICDISEEILEQVNNDINSSII